MKKENKCQRCKKKVISIYSDYNEKLKKVEWLCFECKYGKK